MENPHPVCARILDSVSQSFVGDRILLRKMLAGALANGHILFEDHPGLGKTLLVKTFARILGADFKRIQFTPDLLPGDILGTSVWLAREERFELAKGPVFTNVMLADEINRAPPKTQSALLEAMEERQVTIDGKTHDLPSPFFVLATQNPLEQEGTYPLPEAQLDRFLLRLSTGYPRDIDSETEILRRRLSWKRDDPTREIKPVVDARGFQQMQEEVEDKVYVHPALLVYMSRIVRGVREHPHVSAGPSPRGNLALLRLARAHAYILGRNFVTPDDVKPFVEDVLAHRIVLDVERILEGAEERAVVREVLEKTEAPLRYGNEATAPAPPKKGP
ncbi:MAG TPA: MoxR family ATPase [Candidatus Thermoplasmatota archaeon]|nr:MoxR family ATPase [Candidatus Thermoplasmatota archaeon]